MVVSGLFRQEDRAALVNVGDDFLHVQSHVLGLDVIDDPAECDFRVVTGDHADVLQSYAIYNRNRRGGQRKSLDIKTGGRLV